MEARNKKYSYFNKYFKSVESKIVDGYFPDSRAYFICEMIDKETLFVHGGSNKKKEYTQIDIFDFSNKEWKIIQDISTVDPFFIFDKKLSGHTSNIVDNKGKSTIIVYGGFDGKFYSNAIYLVETENFQFHQVDVRGVKNNNTTSEFPLPRSYHSSNYDQDENCLYIFGGWNGNINTLMTKNFMSLWKFNINVFMWEQIPLTSKTNSQISLRGHTSHILKSSNKLLIYGGVSGFSNIDFIYFYDKEINLVKVEGVIPSGRAFHSSCLIEGKNVIVIYGGILQNQEVSNDLIVYDIPRRMFYPIKNEMNIISNNNLIYPKLFGHTIKRIDQQLFILGGLQDFTCLCKYYYKFQLDNESDKNKAKDHTLILNERDILLDTEAAVNSMKNILIINLNL